MKSNNTERISGRRRPALSRTSIFFIAIITIINFPALRATERSLNVPDSGGLQELSECLNHSIGGGDQEKEPAPEKTAEIVIPPKVTFSGTQPYPEEARSKGITGFVKVRLLIKADGFYELFDVLEEEPEDHGFAEAAVKYLEQSSWTPATRKGDPFDAYFKLTIQFRPKPKPAAENTQLQKKPVTQATGPVDVTPDIVKPVVTFPPNQPYPQRAARLRLPGAVKLRLIIGKDGSHKVIGIISEQPKDLGFAEAAIAYINRSRWKPALKDGEPIDVYYEITIQFNLVY